MVEAQTIHTNGHVINNNYNIVNNFVGCAPPTQETTSSQVETQDAGLNQKVANSVPVQQFMTAPQPLKINTWLQQSSKNLQSSTSFLQSDNHHPANQTEDDSASPLNGNRRQLNLNASAVRAIVDKLGYSEKEVLGFLHSDSNSFVSTLYHKYVTTQQFQQRKLETNNDSIELGGGGEGVREDIQVRDNQNQNGFQNGVKKSNAACSNDLETEKANKLAITSDYSISARLQVQPSYVPSIGCLSSSINQQHTPLNNGHSKFSLTNTSTNNLHMFDQTQ